MHKPVTFFIKGDVFCQKKGFPCNIIDKITTYKQSEFVHAI